MTICLGIYVEFHPGTNDRLAQLAETSAQVGSDRPGLRRPSYVMRRPHLTLFHAMVLDPELTRVRDSVKHIHRFCRAEPVSFKGLSVFGDKFLFLDAHLSPMLRLAHAAAVLALLPYRACEAEPPAQNEGLVLSSSERRNLATFGHPLVGPEYLPHVTLAYDHDPEVIRACHVEAVDLKQQMVAAVRLGIMGEYGSLKEAL